MGDKLYEHPAAVESSARATPRRGYVCPRCVRTDQIVVTRRTLENGDLTAAWFLDGLGYLTAAGSQKILKCRACGALFPVPTGTLLYAFKALVAILAAAVLGLVTVSALRDEPRAREIIDETAGLVVAVVREHPDTSFGLLAGGLTGAAAVTLYTVGTRRAERRRW